MNDRLIFQVACALIALVAVGCTALGVTLHSTPWLVLGGWLGVALAIALTRRGS